MPPPWTDRRPLAQLVPASHAHASVSNPRGWFNNPSLDALTPATFRTAALAWFNTSVSVIEDMGGQGGIVWNVEGEEFGHPPGAGNISYIGSPDMLGTFAPEMDAIADELFALFDSTGLRTGVTIRPTTPTFSSGSGNWFHLNAVSEEEALQRLYAKMQHAVTRWNCRVFYIDTPYWLPPGGDPNVPSDYVLLSSSVWGNLIALQPETLVVPEPPGGNTPPSGWFGNAAPLGQGSLGYRQTASANRPGFSVINMASGDPDLTTPDKRAQYVQGVAGGDIPLFRGWFADEPRNARIKAIYEDGVAAGSGGSSVFLTQVVAFTLTGRFVFTYPPPLAVSAVTATATGSSTIDVSFTPATADGARRYRLARSDDGGTSWQTLTFLAAGQTHTDTGRSQGVGYLYRVFAESAWGEATPATSAVVFTTPTVDPPVAAFTGSPLSGQTPLVVSFLNQSTNSPTTNNWNFGDGGTSTGYSPSHTYAAAGTYTVSLTAGNAGGSDTETKAAYVSAVSPPPPPPTPVAGVPMPPEKVYSQAEDGGLRINWYDSYGATTYKVHVGTSDNFATSAETLVHAEVGSARSVVVTGLANGSGPYRAAVVASNSVGDSAPTYGRDWSTYGTPGTLLGTSTAPQAGVPPESSALPGIGVGYEFDRDSNGTVQVDEIDAFVLTTGKPFTDDGTAKAPRVAGPGGTFARQVVTGASFRGGSERVFSPGYTPFSEVVKLKWGGDGGFAFARFGSTTTMPYEYLADRQGNDVRLRYRHADGVTTGTVTVTGGGVQNQWVTVIAAFNPPAGVVTLFAVLENGTVLSATGALPAAGVYYSKNPSYYGARSDSTGSLNGPVAFGCKLRHAVTAAEATRINAANSLSQLRFLPPSTPGTPPFTNVTRTADFFNPEALGCQGAYYYRTYWDAANSQLFTLWSTDHYDGNVLPDPQGIWRAVVPNRTTTATSKTLIIPTAYNVPANSNWSGTGNLQAETPWYVYNPSGAYPGHPHWVYHQIVAPRSGIANSQQTVLVTFSADWSVRTYRGVSHPNGIDSGGRAQNHTGYQKVYPPGSFPGTPAGEWLSMGINNTDGSIVLSKSTDGLTFNCVNPVRLLDTTSKFPMWSLTSWTDQLFVADGRIFGVGMGRHLQHPAQRYKTIDLVEVGLDDSGYPTKVIGGPWELYHGFGSYPGLGYIQDVKLDYEGDGTRILHVFPMRGTYAEGGVIGTRDQVIDRIQLEMVV